MPPMLMGPLGKVLGVCLVIVALVLVGEWHGRRAVQQRWDAAIARQAMEAASVVIQAAENTAAVETRYEQATREQAERVRVVTKEVVRYVQSPAEKCSASPELVRAVDAVSGLLDGTTDGMSSASGAAGAAPVSNEAPITDAEILRAYEAAVVELADLWDTYAALVEWVESSYALSRDGSGR